LNSVELNQLVHSRDLVVLTHDGSRGARDTINPYLSVGFRATLAAQAENVHADGQSTGAEPRATEHFGKIPMTMPQDSQAIERRAIAKVS
jgi:hypothetical protein